MIEHTGTTEIECASCGTFFLLPPAEHVFRREHGLNRPELCPVCRSERRANRHSDVIAGHEQAEPSARTGGTVKKLAIGGPGGGRLYNAVCDQCGGPARVPFIPRGDRPVYCRDCYNARKGR